MGVKNCAPSYLRTQLPQFYQFSTSVAKQITKSRSHNDNLRCNTCGERYLYLADHTSSIITLRILSSSKEGTETENTTVQWASNSSKR